MSEIDWLKGTPAKIKDIALSELEKRFANVVDEVVNGEGKTQAKITMLDMSDDMRGKVEMHIKFEQYVDMSFLSEEKEAIK